jgi:hypothetical protein
MDNTRRFYRVFRVWEKKFAVKKSTRSDFRAQIPSKSQQSPPGATGDPASKVLFSMSRSFINLQYFSSKLGPNESLILGDQIYSLRLEVSNFEIMRKLLRNDVETEISSKRAKLRP